MTLLQKFGIPLTDNLEAYNLIGIDFGDGEISAATVEQDAISGNLLVRGLSLQENGMHWKNVNAFYISANEVSLVYDATAHQSDEGLRYYNYKKCPQDEAADSKYLFDDGYIGAMTYRELMVTCFNCLVNKLFESNVYALDRNKPTILLVGRPSSPGWAASELEYARMLQEGLRLPANQKPVYVAIQSESTAALAREIDPKWDAQRVKKGEIVVVLDSGSSTFDITVIASGGVVGESSFQFGGNQLDENLLKLMKQAVERNHPDMEYATAHGHKLGLRIAKESYYGLKGTGRQAQLHGVDLQGPQGKHTYQFLLDEAAMNQALSAMPVRAFRFKTNLAGQASKSTPVMYKSWLDACRGIYASFYEEMKCHFSKEGTDPAHRVVPDRIILSGGVSVMPEVQAAVEEAFGTKPRLTDRPKYSVSEGLAYVLGTEMQKKQLLDRLIAQMDQQLPGADTLKRHLCGAGVDEDWESLSAAMTEWANSPRDLSINDWDALWQNKYFRKEVVDFVQKGTEQWYREHQVEDTLTKLLQDHFARLFPEYVEQFHAKLPRLDFNTLPFWRIEIETGLMFFFGVDKLTGDDLTLPRDAQWRAQASAHFHRTERLIREGGQLTFAHMVQVRRGIGPFARMVEQPVRNLLNYPGLRSYYEAGIPDEFVESTRSQIGQLPLCSRFGVGSLPLNAIL